MSENQNSILTQRNKKDDQKDEDFLITKTPQKNLLKALKVVDEIQFQMITKPDSMGTVEIDDSTVDTIAQCYNEKKPETTEKTSKENSKEKSKTGFWTKIWLYFSHYYSIVRDFLVQYKNVWMGCAFVIVIIGFILLGGLFLYEIDKANEKCGPNNKSCLLKFVFSSLWKETGSDLITVIFSLKKWWHPFAFIFEILFIYSFKKIYDSEKCEKTFCCCCSYNYCCICKKIIDPLEEIWNAAMVAVASKRIYEALEIIWCKFDNETQNKITKQLDFIPPFHTELISMSEKCKTMSDVPLLRNDSI